MANRVGAGLQDTENLSDALIRNANRRQRMRLLFGPLQVVILVVVATAFDGAVANVAQLAMLSASGAFVLSLATWFRARNYPRRIRQALASPNTIKSALTYPNGISSCIALEISGERLLRFQKVDPLTIDKFVGTMTEASVPLKMFNSLGEYTKALRALA